MGRYPEADLSRLKLLSVRDRTTRVTTKQFGRVGSGEDAASLIDRLPQQLGAETLRAVVEAVVEARQAGRPVILLVGAHVIKVGVAPYLIAWMKRGIATHLAVHGAGAIHDLEIALFGNTSEDVDSNLQTGAFGLVRETGEFFFDAAREAVEREEGLGEALGRGLTEGKAPHRQLSLLAEAFEESVPATVHVAIGTDTVHAHPGGDGAALGEASLRDFRILAQSLTKARGAVVLNLGSAVVLPEVFLKALTVAVNLGASMENLTTVNIDQLQHYRPRLNIIERPTRAQGARGFSLTGQHEILLPLLFEAVLARIPQLADSKPTTGP